MKKGFIFGLIFIMMISSVMGAYYDTDTDLLLWNECESDLTDSGSYGYNLTAVASVTYDNTNPIQNYFCDFASGGAQRATDIQIGTNNFTISLWGKNNNGAGTNYLLYLAYAGDTNRVVARQQIATTEHFFFHLGGSGENDLFSGDDYNGNTWNFYVYKRNSTETELTIYDSSCNILEQQQNGLYDGQDVTGGDPNIKLGYDGGTAYSGYKIDELRIYKRELTGTEIEGLCDFSYLGGGGTTPSVTLSTNIIDGDSIGFLDFSDGVYKFNVNATSVNNSDIYDVKIYVNGTLNKTYSSLDLSSNIELNWTDFLNIEQMINLTIEATNENASNSLSYDVYFDGIYPEISQAGLFNNSVYYKNYTSDFYINMSAGDNNLFAINYTLTEGNAIISTLFNDSITGSLQNDQFLINMTLLTTGSYVYNVRAWDSHTAKSIKDYRIKETLFDNKKAYEIEDGIYIFGDDINTIDFYKLTDRYTFEIDFKKSDPDIEIFADDLKYIENSPFEAHFVSLKYNKWIDFVIDGSNQAQYNIIQIGPGHYKISLLTPDKKIKFKSIGDLNVFEAEYYFNVSNSMSIFAVDSFSNTTILNFTILVNGQSYTTTTGEAYINITSGSYETNTSSGSYVDNSTLVNYTAGGSFNFVLTADKSLYLLVYDEQTNLLIDDRNITIEVINFENESFSYITNDGTKFISGFAPGDYEIRYLTNGYNPRTYYTTIATQTTQSLRLYMLNSSVASYIAFTIEDETGNTLEDAIVSATRFYVDCNCYRVVEMDKANFQGQAIFSLQKYDTRYNFIINYGGSIVYSSTAGYKLTSDIYTLPVSLLGDTTRSYFGINQDVYSQLSYNNATKIITFSVADDTDLVDHFCIYVDQMNALSDAGYLRICNNCLTAQTGSVTCNISDYYANGREIISKGFIETNTNFSSYWTDVLSIVTDTTGKAVTGKVGVFMTLLISLTLSMIAFSIGGPVFAIIGLDLGLIVSNIVGIFYIGLPGIFAIVGVSFVIIYLIGERS